MARRYLTHWIILPDCLSIDPSISIFFLLAKPIYDKRTSLQSRKMAKRFKATRKNLLLSSYRSRRIGEGFFALAREFMPECCNWYLVIRCIQFQVWIQRRASSILRTTKPSSPAAVAAATTAVIVLLSGVPYMEDSINTSLRYWAYNSSIYVFLAFQHCKR